jgi:ATPase subunit of ABC transporter with duplicated ATPase domains
MSLVLDVHAVSFAYATTGVRLFDGVSFRLARGQKACLVGANGAGKTTLLSLLAGELAPDSGTVAVNGRVAWFKQVDAAAVAAGDDDDDDADATVESWLDAKAVAGELEFEAVHAIVRALKLPAEARVAALSPGQLQKLRLSCIVLRPGVDLLLMDEPTTHLDLSTVLFLERLVRRSPIAVLVVSHDARFLQATVDVVLELDHATKSLRTTTSSFDDYLLARERRREAAAAAEESRQKRAAALEAESRSLHADGVRGTHFVTGDSAKLQRDFMRERAGRSLHAAGVKARQKQRVLEEERDSDVPGEQLEFDLLGAGGEPVVLLDNEHALSLTDAVFGYGDVRQFGPLSVSINVGERVLILGQNGSGKSSTLAALAGHLPLRAGDHNAGRGVRLGVLQQASDCGLDAAQVVIAAVEAALLPRAVKRDAHFHRLRKVGISHTAALRPIGELSPGLTARLALLLLMVRGVNMLFLDEVTNFVDRGAKDAILAFLPTFAGGIVCVTHDRELMHAVEWSRVLAVRDDGSAIDQQDANALQREVDARSIEADQIVNVLLTK